MEKWNKGRKRKQTYKQIIQGTQQQKQRTTKWIQPVVWSTHTLKHILNRNTLQQMFILTNIKHQSTTKLDTYLSNRIPFTLPVVFLSCPLLKKHADLFGSFLY